MMMMMTTKMTGSSKTLDNMVAENICFGQLKVNRLHHKIDGAVLVVDGVRMTSIFLNY